MFNFVKLRVNVGFFLSLRRVRLVIGRSSMLKLRDIVKLSRSFMMSDAKMYQIKYEANLRD